MRYTGKIDLFGTAWALSLEQYADSPKLKALVEAFIGNGQPFEDAIGRLTRWANLDEAEGAWLDILGGIKNLHRKPGESDKDYRDRLKVYLRVDDSGTPDNAVSNARDISGDPSPQYLDEAPATFFIYTPNGRQLPRKTLRALAPAGVLALPGAALKTVDADAFIVTAEGKRILAVARDIESGRLLSEAGERMTTEDRKSLMTEGT